MILTEHVEGRDGGELRVDSLHLRQHVEADGALHLGRSGVLWKRNTRIHIEVGLFVLARDRVHGP